MQRTVIVVDENKSESEELCRVLQQENYQTLSLNSLADLPKSVQETPFSVVILDLDNLPVNNQFIRHLKRQKENVRIMGLSSRPFHPELEEAVSTHLYACLGKPVDTDEVLYWLRSIDANE
jgi:DNA-binding NtrC family response regulator